MTQYANEWERRWDQGRTRFHSEAVHSDLESHAQRFLGDRARTILVPLCGKSVDMRHFESLGHEVTGVELVAKAVDAFWSEGGVEPERDRVGAFERSRAGRIEILRGDALELTSGPWDRVWDRAALVALEPEQRRRYVEVLRRVVAPGALVLLVAYGYDQSRMEGPPFSVPEDEVRELYAGCSIEVLAQRDVADAIPFDGHDYWVTSTYLIEVPG